MKKELICINCPQGCHLDVDFEEATGNCAVKGNRCPRGAEYARQELTDPRRIVTAVMKTDSPDEPYIPVRTNKPFPQAKIPALLNRLYQMTVKIPIKCGDIVIDDVENTQISVIVAESRK